MSDLVLTPRSGLESLLAPGRHGAEEGALGVTITPRAGLALASVIVRAGKTDSLVARAEATFGLTLPLTPRRVAAGTIGFVWAGPGQWLAATEHVDGSVFERTLRQDFDSLASVVDQSDGRSVIRVSGPQARAALAKGVPLDLHPRVFRTGDAALSIAGHINVHFWQRDDAPVYEFAVFRSFAGAFCAWLLDAAAEFGVLVTEPA